MHKLWNQTDLRFNPGYTPHYLSFRKVSEPRWTWISSWVNTGWSLLPYKVAVVQKDTYIYTTWSRIYRMIGDTDATRRQLAELQLQEMFLIKNISFCDLKFTNTLATKPRVKGSRPTTGCTGDGNAGLFLEEKSPSLAWAALAQGHLDGLGLVEPSWNRRAV